MNTAAIVTISDKGSRGEREDTSGAALAELLAANGYVVSYRVIVPDDAPAIQEQLITCADELHLNLVVTTGGTGFTRRDITPEATSAVIERFAPGISEHMRAESAKITPNGILSRGVSGIRGDTLIVNLPGSEKAARECLGFVLPALNHAFKMLGADSVEHGEGQDGISREQPTDGAAHAHCVAVCVSEKKGTQKVAVPSANLRENYGIEGDAHAGDWHRQVSLLAKESVDELQSKVQFTLKPGAFAENILTSGLRLHALPVGARLQIGDTLLEVTQIGKECHNDCAIRRAAGDCVMPREGIFARVLRGGTIEPRTAVRVLK